MKYEILPHTADGKFKAFGESLEERFGNAVLAMFSFMFKIDEIEPKIRKKIHATGNDEKSLLYSWLEEFLYLLDAEAFIPSKVEKIKITKTAKGFEITGVLLGDKVGEHKHIGSVKAITYAEMEIKDNYVQVVVDL